MAFLLEAESNENLNTQVKIFGIRHHGVGSALRLRSALNLFRPNVICVEMPFESGESITQLQNYPHTCPLAFLYYNNKNAEQTMYFPFSDFSPEYQAMSYASSNKIPLYPIDLPAGISIHSNNFNKQVVESLDFKSRNMIHDPLGYLAKKSGYSDTERWWDSYFESWTDSLELFDIIHQLMLELRKSTKGLDDAETLVREEFMRVQINKHLSSNPEKLAIVCGAWHSPALEMEPSIPIHHFNLSSLKNSEMKTGIIPWSYARLSMQKSYTAGIESPVWSECMFIDPKKAISLWLSKAAKQFRKSGFRVSTAELIDCEKLALELAMIREIPIPGIEELMDSCITVIGKGETERIHLIQEQLIIGDRIGDIEMIAQNLPLVVEFKSNLKKLKLNKYWNDGDTYYINLDLRKPNHLSISRFLHQCVLINISWCNIENPDINPLGNFHEFWSLRWNPEVEVKLINAAILAPTIEGSILQLLQKTIENENNLEILANILEHGIKSDLPNIWEFLIGRIKLLSIQSNEVEGLCNLIRPLIATIQYGNLHLVDMNQLSQILEHIIPKIILEFSAQCSFIKPNQAKRMIKCLNLLNSYFLHFKNNEYYNLWVNELISASTNESIHSLIRGRLWYLALEEKWCTSDNFKIEMEYQFLRMNDASKTAYWIEGFMHQSTNFFLFQDAALQIMSTWIAALDEGQFKNLLPILRRSFSDLSNHERQRIFQKFIKPKATSSDQPVIITKIHPMREQEIYNLLNSLGINKSDEG